MSKSEFAAIIATTGLLLTALAVVGPAQVTTADIVGKVTDTSGAAMPGSKVTLTNLGTGDVRTLDAGSDGDYLFTLLPIGRYSIRITAPGFKTFAVSSLTLAGGDRTRVDAQMELGQVLESIEVSGQTPALQTETATVGALVSQQAVEDLPVNGRNFMLLAQVVPGANAGDPNALASGNRPDDRRQSSSLSVNGQPEYLNNYMIDGTDNNERAIATMVIRPSMDALAEFRVQTNTYTAELGRVAGGVVSIITKSGTNGLHGSLFEYFRNDKLDAWNTFSKVANAVKPEYRLNQFGGSLGGAIVKDKAFFFGDYEGLRVRQGQPYTSTVPTMAMRSGNFSGVAAIFDPLSIRANPNVPGSYIRDEFPGDVIPASRISSIAAKYMALYPTPQTSGLANNFACSNVKTQNQSTLDSRVDERINDTNYAYVRYSFNNTDTLMPGILPTIDGIAPAPNPGQYSGPAGQRAQNIQFNMVHIFPSNVVLEGKAVYSRYASQSFPLNYGQNLSQQFGLSGVTFDNYSTGLTLMTPAGYAALGDSAFLPLLQFDNTFQYLGTLTFTKGPHSFKAGAELIRRQLTVAQSSRPRGEYNYDANMTNAPSGATASSGNSIASWLLGDPSLVQRINQPVEPGYRTWEPGFFVQDDWHVARFLTLNIGARYDVFTPFTEVANRMANIDLSKFQVEVAGQNGYSSTAGVKTDWSNVAPRFGFDITPARNWVIRGGFGVSYAPTNTTSYAQLKNPPFAFSWSVQNPTAGLPLITLADGVPLPTFSSTITTPSGALRMIAPDFRSAMVMQDNLTVQREFAGNVLSVGYVSALGRHERALPDLNQPLPGAGSIAPRRTYYTQMPGVTTLEEMASTANSSYHTLQATFERRFKSGLMLNASYNWAHDLGSGTIGPMEVTGSAHLEKGPLEYDIRHRGVMMANYELPFGKKLTGAAKRAFAGWQVNALALWSTGMAYSVTNATSRTNTGGTGPDRPNRVGSGILSAPTVQEWFDTSAFVAQPMYTAGNSGVGILQGPPQRKLDTSLFKSIQLREAYTLTFRAECFNLTNTSSYALPNATLGSPAFGTISSTGNNTPRQFQLALKVLF